LKRRARAMTMRDGGRKVIRALRWWRKIGATDRIERFKRLVKIGAPELMIKKG
jgi:hypothetical protein